MSNTRHRFTGENPPLDVLRQIPNWEYALDEEGLPGQDETTIRPAQVQSHLVDEVAFTAGRVTCANGMQLDALLEVDCRTVTGITVFDGSKWAWSLRKLGKPPRWQPIDFAWLPETERPPIVRLEDARIFPLEVAAELPTAECGTPVQFRILPTGNGAA